MLAMAKTPTDALTRNAIAEAHIDPKNRSRKNMKKLAAFTCRPGITKAKIVTRSYSTSGPVSTGMGDRLRRTNHLSISTSHSGQLSLLPSTGQKMSTSQSAVMLCGWGVKVGMVHSTCEKNVWVWQVKLCDPSLTRAIPERFRVESRESAIQIYGYQQQ